MEQADFRKKGQSRGLVRGREEGRCQGWFLHSKLGSQVVRNAVGYLEMKAQRVVCGVVIGLGRTWLEC